mgnify:CR=1 FL=1
MIDFLAFNGVQDTGGLGGKAKVHSFVFGLDLKHSFAGLAASGTRFVQEEEDELTCLTYLRGRPAPPHLMLMLLRIPDWTPLALAAAAGLVSSKTFQNLRVSSAAADTTVHPSGEVARCRTLDV